MEIIDLIIITGIIIIIISLFIYICKIDNDIHEYFTEYGIGPIKFVDSKTNELLSKYPNNWNERDVEKKGLTTTLIKIPKGEQGDRGSRGDKG